MPGWCKEPPNKAWAGLGRDIGQFSIGFALGYSKSSIGDPAVSASLEKKYGSYEIGSMYSKREGITVRCEQG